MPENVGGKGDGPAGMFLFGEAEQIGGVADLRFYFLLAVAVVVVRDDGDHHAAMVARADLEGLAVVVDLVGIAPAHAVAFLPGGGLGHMRQAERGFIHTDQVRRQDHAAGVAGPVRDVESGVVFGQVRIAGIAED